MKHTQGEWHYYTEPQPNGCPIVGNDKGIMVAMIAHSIHEKNQAIEAIANARLISASPELLDFAQEWLARQGTDKNYMTAKACAAIAKATGETQ